MDSLTPDQIEPNTQKPKLYSSGQVVAASVLGTAVAGGWLLSRNLKKVGEESFARNTLLASFGFMFLIAMLAMYVPTDFPNSPFGALIGAVFYFWYKQSFSERYASLIETGGTKESSWKVAGIALISVPVGLAILIAVAIFVPIRPMNYLQVGENYVFYEGNATRKDAEKLAGFLTDQGVFIDAIGWEFGVDIPCQAQKLRIG